MQNKPRVDVIIPIYNGQNYVLSALDSILKQTYLPSRIIAVNDGSTDDTEFVINKYIESHKNIPVKIIQVKKQNGGLSSARNEGIKYSLSQMFVENNDNYSPDFIAFLDVDDVWHADKLKKQLDCFEKNEFLYQNKNIGVVYCGYDLIDENGTPIIKDEKNKKLFVAPELKGNVFAQLLQSNRISGSGSAVIIKQEYLNKVGLFDETLKACEDWDMWLRLAQLCEFDFVNEELVSIRRHGESMQANLKHMLKNEMRFYTKWMRQLKRIPLKWVVRILRRVWQICVQ